MGVFEVLRVSKLTDYATVIMTVLASVDDAGGVDDVLSAQDLAARARLELPTVSKLLKQLAHAQLVSSTRGVNGGYRLARAPQQITIADIVTAMEGPIGMTECGAHCGVRVNWQRINQAIAQALAEVTVADMVKPAPKRHPAIPVQLATA
jgi:FeS assembly SUF system regulator